MATYHFNVQTYKLTVANRPFGMGAHRQIILEGRSGTIERKAMLNFVPDASPNVTIQSNDIMRATFPLSEYEFIVDILRNEKPAFFYGTEGTFARLSTSDEPVGEEES